jgi:microcystin degradation protein MlrC
LDGIYLALHGAFLSEKVEDVEGEILEEVRETVGRVPVVISCDLHAHITPKMMDLADMIIGYKHYPHDDARETGERCADLLLRTLKAEIRPLMRKCKAPMIVPPLNCRTEGEGPLARIGAWARAREEEEALSVSYFPVQPWLDLPDVGFTAMAITDDDHDGANRIALELCKKAWALRRDFNIGLYKPEEAIRRGLDIEGGPVILSDTADCVGGGGSGDSAVVLRALLDCGTAEPAVMLIVDPETVHECKRPGVGGRFQARIGNKLNPVYGEPVEAEAQVLRIFDGDFFYRGGILAGPAAMGPSAVLKVGSARVVVSSYSSYEYADEQFLAAGLDPHDFKFVVVKNPMNYLAAYAYAPAKMVLDTPGPTACNLAAVPWQHITRPRFPVDDDFQPEFK